MKLLIEIPNQDYIYIAKKHCLPSCDDKTLRRNFYEVIANGKPLDSVLDEIRAEINKLPDLNPDYEMDKTIHVSKWAVHGIIDKYKAESEEEDG